MYYSINNYNLLFFSSQPPQRRIVIVTCNIEAETVDTFTVLYLEINYDI